MTFHNRPVDKLCIRLAELGVPARVAEPGRPEEEFLRGSRELIDILDEGPIHWVNLHFDPGLESYDTEYGVPDSRSLPEVRVRSIRVKTAPVFGKVVGVRWQGKDGGLGIADRLQSDAELSHVLERTPEVFVHHFHKHNCWIIGHDGTSLTAERWRCYQAIARHLLTEWPEGDSFLVE